MPFVPFTIPTNFYIDLFLWAYVAHGRTWKKQRSNSWLLLPTISNCLKNDQFSKNNTCPSISVPFSLKYEWFLSCATKYTITNVTVIYLDEVELRENSKDECSSELLWPVFWLGDACWRAWRYFLGFSIKLSVFKMRQADHKLNSMHWTWDWTQLSWKMEHVSVELALY